MINNTITVELDGAYASGHKAHRTVEVRPPTEEELCETDLESWWNDAVFPETGDGRPNDVSCWEAKILAAPTCPQIIGRTYEWVG